MNQPKESKILVFERLFGARYSVREKYFYILLRTLWRCRKGEDGWLLFHDLPIGNRDDAFRYYGLSPRICHGARKKLVEDGLIECQQAHGPKGHRIGMKYRILDAKVDADPKAVHAAIMSGLEQGVVHKPEGSQGVQGLSEPVSS